MGKKMIVVNEEQVLALNAVFYGCNTNKRLVGSTYLQGLKSNHPKEIKFYDALKIVSELLESMEQEG